MTGLHKQCIFAILVFAFCRDICAQPFRDQFFFKRFNTKDGLSQASVNSILHDTKGFMWFGTDDGLNRFDGSHFKIFRQRTADSTSLYGNMVVSMVEDSSGYIWVGTSEGLSRFDRHYERFTSFFLKDAEYFISNDLKLDPDNNSLWVAAGDEGVCVLDLETNELKRFLPEKFRNINVLKIERIDNVLFVGTFDHGLLKVDISTGVIEKIALQEKKNRSDEHRPIRALLHEGNNLWVGSEGAGLFKVNITSGSVDFYGTKNGLVSDDKIWSLGFNKTDGSIWVGTDGGGLTFLDGETKSPTFFKNSEYNERTISGNTIRSLIIDRSGGVWMGTFNGGISYYANTEIHFITYRKDPENPFSLHHNAVLSFCEAPDGSLLVGTDGGGLNYFKDNKFYKYKFPSSISHPKVILAIHRTRAGGIFLGTYQEGLLYIDPSRKVYQYLYNGSDQKTISSNIVWDIEEDNEGNIWLATELGINRFNPGTGEFTHAHNLREDDNPAVFTDDFLQTLLIDKDQILHAGFYGYLISYDLKSGKLKSFSAMDSVQKQIPNKQFLSLCEDPFRAGVFWFSAFGGGLVQYDKHKETFINTNEDQGLPNNLIFALRCDRQGNVWCTSDKGLIRYNPNTQAYYVFNKDFGVDTSPFKDNAAYIHSTGYFLFGGTQGFTAFKPKDITFDKGQLKVAFTDFQLFHKDVQIDNQILHKSIAETTELELTQEQAKFITLGFSAINFISPSTLQYQYMLEGFENSWREADGKQVSITSLLPGDYTVRVKAGYPSGVWGDEIKLKIKVIPPWFATWYAKAVAGLLSVSFAYAFFRFRTYNLMRRKLMLERIVAEQNKEIRAKNVELAAQNEELIQHNEELLTHRETISMQNRMLQEAQEKLKEINQSLECLVQQRTEKLNETIVRLNKSIKELDSFLYSASHDLVAPLKSILGIVNLAKKENSNSQIDIYFDHIETSVRKLEQIIHTLMQHSFNAKAVSKLQEVDIKALVEETVSELRFLPESKKMKFKLALEHTKIVTDIPRLKIILGNLINNAIKYHDSRKDNNAIEIRYIPTADSWTLEILDNGIGIEQSRVSRVFDMFYRATESAKGSGLGLYIVKETVERLNGTIHVDSEYGVWTKFTVTFPYVTVSELTDS